MFGENGVALVLIIIDHPLTLEESITRRTSSKLISWKGVCVILEELGKACKLGNKIKGKHNKDIYELVCWENKLASMSSDIEIFFLDH